MKYFTLQRSGSRITIRFRPTLLAVGAGYQYGSRHGASLRGRLVCACRWGYYWRLADLQLSLESRLSRILFSPEEHAWRSFTPQRARRRLLKAHLREYFSIDVPETEIVGVRSPGSKQEYEVPREV